MKALRDESVPNIMVIGHGRSGKDTFAAFLAYYLKCDYLGSSQVACEQAVFPHLDYITPEECYDDRHNHRETWRDLISKYNKDPSRLGKYIYSQCNIYCGIRSKREFEALKDLIDVTIYVVRDVPVDPTFELKLEDADCYVHNSADLLFLEKQAEMIAREIHEYV